ncbi:MAG: sensor histidine kinase [Sarcina sp.]
MGTKWTESKNLFQTVEQWFTNYNLQLRSIENFIMLVVLIGFPIMGTILTDGNEIHNHYIPYKKALLEEENYINERLTAQSNQISGQVDKKIPLLDKLRDEKSFNEQKSPALEDVQGVQDIGVVVFDTKTKKFYSNKAWVNDFNYEFNSSIEIIDAITAEEKIIAQKYIDNTGNAKVKDGFEQIYFSNVEIFTTEIATIRMISGIAICFIIIFMILFVKKIWMFKKLGLKLYRDSLRWGYLMKIKNAIKTFIERSILFEEVLKDKVVWIVLSFAICTTTIKSIIEGITTYNMFPFFEDYEKIVVIGVPIILTIHFLIKILYRYEAIEVVSKNLKSIEMGNFDIEIRYEDDLQIRKLSKGINDIRIGYKTAIEERLASEKVKTELISNVSHDLKTPLTSIINYVNIIQRDDVTLEEKKEYMSILEQKSIRLKDLIEDLFEVSKMNSGKINLDKYDIDIVQLLHQCIGELEDYNTEKNMDFIIKGEQELIVNLDGMRMARVFQNLGTNALKYGLNNTRVYVNVIDKNEYVEISFKNISQEELDFDAKDIVERFYRGDKSRNSDVEGSGLGLAIVKSIVELHDGKFRVECEGDLFKAYILIPKEIKNIIDNDRLDIEEVIQNLD